MLAIWDAGYFRPKRTLLVLNEGVIREGRTVSGAFEKTLSHPGFEKMLQAGAVAILMQRLACMDLVKASGAGFYAAASGEGDKPLDPVEEFMVGDWIEDLEGKREKAGTVVWLP